MSLASEMEAYFDATKAPVLRDSLAFKAKLGIGEKLTVHFESERT